MNDVSASPPHDPTPSSASRSRIKALLAGKGSWLLLLPAFWAFVSYVQGAVPTPMAEGPPRPALVFNQYLVDLGKVPPQRFVHAYFRFVNRGTGDVDIKELFPSCGCLKPKIERKHYAPGEAGEFFLRIETAQENPGDHEYFLDINYVDPQPRVARVTFKVHLPDRQVLVEPPGLIFYQLSPVDSTREVVITNFRDKPLNVTEARSSSKYVTVEVLPSERDVEGNQLIRANITASGHVPPGRQRAMVVFSTDDPEFSEIGVHIVLHGPEGMIRPAGHEKKRGGERGSGGVGVKTSR